MGNLRPVENRYTLDLEYGRAEVQRESNGTRSVIIYRLGELGSHLCHASFAPKQYDPEVRPDLFYRVRTDAIARRVDPDTAKAFMRAIHYDFDTTGPRDGDAWEVASKKEARLVSLYTAVGYEVMEQDDGLLLVRKNTF